MRYIDVCDTIARSGILTKKDGTKPYADEIFRYSQTGELFMIHVWFEYALVSMALDGALCLLESDFYITDRETVIQ